MTDEFKKELEGAELEDKFVNNGTSRVLSAVYQKTDDKVKNIFYTKPQDTQKTETIKSFLVYGTAMVKPPFVDAGIKTSDIDPGRVQTVIRLYQGEGPVQGVLSSPSGLGDEETELVNVFIGEPNSNGTTTPVSIVNPNDGRPNWGDVVVKSAIGAGVPVLFDQIFADPENEIGDTDPVTGKEITKLADQASPPVKVDLSGLRDVKIVDSVRNSTLVYNSCEAVWESKYLLTALEEENGIFLDPNCGGGGGGSPLTTKGDLFTYSTEDTRLPLGSSGMVLTVNTSNPTGLEWQTHPGGGDGEANTASNLGGGEGLYFTKQGVNLQFKSLQAGSNVTLTANNDEITINSTATGGGGAEDFLDLQDTPASYAGHADKCVVVNSSATGLTFINCGETPPPTVDFCEPPVSQFEIPNVCYFYDELSERNTLLFHISQDRGATWQLVSTVSWLDYGLGQPISPYDVASKINTDLKAYFGVLGGQIIFYYTGFSLNYYKNTLTSLERFHYLLFKIVIEETGTEYFDCLEDKQEVC